MPSQKIGTYVNIVMEFCFFDEISIYYYLKLYNCLAPLLQRSKITLVFIFPTFCASNCSSTNCKLL